MSKCVNESEGERNKEGNEKKKTPQESRNERMQDFLQENFFHRFPQGRAALCLKVLKAQWKDILTAQSCFAVKSNISRPHKIIVL